MLNHLILDPDAGRIVVIMNEFGDVGLDHDLIEASTEETILLPSGCLCCSIRGDLLKTLGKLIARRSKGDLSFDRVVVETTGIADPGPILHSLVVDQIVGPAFRMDGVVTLADAATGPSTLETQEEAVRQIAMADLIVLSKTDLVTPAALSRFKAQIAEINGPTRCVQATHGYVPTGTLFGLSAMYDGVTAAEVSKWLDADASRYVASPRHTDSDVEDSRPTESHSAKGHAHTFHHHHQIISASIEIHQLIAPKVFDFWLDTLIGLKGPNILRMKGIVHVEDVSCPFVFHGVQHIFDAPVPLESWSGEDTVSRVVVIARGMERDDLAASLNILRVQPDAADAAPRGMMTQYAKMVH